ncbi:hypothetical protein IEZ26_06705 [Nocardioides cavernae]|uniref:Uncharacterized protein n=1 Tax=Nocardioides cavernae TaxID=1921566 RepID=A0ABR8NAP9_9ACTN|nr:hypothetical protein [Nocardioides cavernae]MBD3924306.1 hypothetical protein [Nocardioides cavernae]MBM7510752.1 hypothetical protein [Nocardioides cavernae]
MAAKNGWTPRQYRALLLIDSLDAAQHRDNDVPYMARVDAWVSSSIPAEWVLRYRSAGYSPCGAQELEPKRLGGELLSEAVATLVALRGTSMAVWLDYATRPDEL